MSDMRQLGREDILAIQTEVNYFVVLGRVGEPETVEFAGVTQFAAVYAGGRVALLAPKAFEWVTYNREDITEDRDGTVLLKDGYKMSVFRLPSAGRREPEPEGGFFAAPAGPAETWADKLLKLPEMVYELRNALYNVIDDPETPPAIRELLQEASAKTVLVDSKVNRAGLSVKIGRGQP